MHRKKFDLSKLDEKDNSQDQSDSDYEESDGSKSSGKAKVAVKKSVTKRKRYNHIPMSTKMELMRMSETHTIKSASEMLNINYSTAKNIIKRYQKRGNFSLH